MSGAGANLGKLEALLQGKDAAAAVDTVLRFIPSGAVIVQAPDGKILRSSDFAAQVLGRPRSEFEGRLLAEVGETLHPQDVSGQPLPPDRWPLTRALRGEKADAVEYSVEAADGRRVPLIGYAVPIHSGCGEIIGAICSVSEFKHATEHKLYEALEQRLRESHLDQEDHNLDHKLAELIVASMLTVLAKANDAAIVLRADERVVLFTPAAEQMFEVAAADALDGAFSRFVPERHREICERSIRELLRGSGQAIQRLGGNAPVFGLRANGEEFPMEVWVSRVRIHDNVYLAALLHDISEGQLAKDTRVKRLIAHETEHRAKNALTAVQALVKATKADTPEELKRTLHGRISAYANGLTLLMKCAWEDVELCDLVEAQLGATVGLDQIRMRGPKVRIAPQGVQALSLVLHELATNAREYGALSKETGAVEVTWEIGPGPMLEMTWRETGGPTGVGTPAASGFGAVLLRHVLGRLSFDWRPEGLTAMLSLPPPAFRLKSSPKDEAAATTPNAGGNRRSLRSS